MSEKVPQYVVQFRGKISWDGRANGLPEYIYAFLIFDGYNREVFIKAIEEQAAIFARGQGMSVQQEQGIIIDMRQMPSDRMFVPMRWIVFIDVKAFQLSEELTIPDENGVEKKKDGTEPLPN